MQIWNVSRVFRIKFLGVITLMVACSLQVKAQNSPYSQFGLGDLSNSQNITNRAMGGVSQAYADGQTINFLNPASYADLQLTTLEVGVDGGSRKIMDLDTNSYRSNFGTLSYLQLGVPLKKGGGWGLTFGLTPLTDVSYNIQKKDSLKGIGEPVNYLYQGSGGAYQAFVGTGFRIKGFRFGVNAGYLFGSLQQNIQAIYPSDSLGLFNSNKQTRTGYGSFFWNAGMQVHIKLGKDLGLELGASGGLEQKLKADRDYLVETFYYSGDPSDQTPQNQDTAYYSESDKGTITYPGHYAVGFLLHNKGNWSIGADYQASNWGDYRYYGAKDSVQDSWTFRVGAQYVPSVEPGNKSYWNMVAYRLGFYTGKDYIRYGGTDIKKYAFSFGFGFPVRNFMRTGQYTLINTAFEFGKRGNKNNPLSENFFRLSLGFTLSDVWFIERKFQ